MPGVGILTATETVQGTQRGLHGLAVPAPTRFDFVSLDANYRARLSGLITSELTPRRGGWSIRGQGHLDLSDTAGNHGRMTLDRAGRVLTTITTPHHRIVQVREDVSG